MIMPYLQLQNTQKMMRINRVSRSLMTRLWCMCSEQKQTATTFYRSSIRTANTRPSDRGIFTQHALLKMLTLAEPTDINLLFQAYYNFLGHFTVMSNTTVDKLLHKIIQLGTMVPESQQQTGSKLIELLNHHDYLRYYPHYDVTEKCIKFVQGDVENMRKLVEVLQQKPLIKLNVSMIRMMVSTDDWGVFCRVVKLLAWRVNRGLLDIGFNEAVDIIIDGIGKFSSIRRMNMSQQYRKLLQQAQQSSQTNEQKVKVAICYAITTNQLRESTTALKQVPEAVQQPYWQVVGRITSNTEFNYSERAKQMLHAS